MAQGRILVAQERLLVAQGTILVAQGSISGFGKNNNEDMSQKDQGMTARKPSKHIISDSGKNKSVSGKNIGSQGRILVAQGKS